eukprot:384552-Rhodomonas_salina.1
MKKVHSNPEVREAEKPKWQEYSKNKYQNDPEVRERKKKQALARYYRLKAEKQTSTTSSNTE